MELTSSVNDTWKYFAAGSFAGFFLLLLLAYQTHPYTSLLAAQTAVLDFAHLGDVDAAKANGAIEPVLEDAAAETVMNMTVQQEEKPEKKTAKKCNMFEGKWVYKPEEDPGYDSIRCPFIEEKMSCRKNGRPDFEYENWRWEDRDCDIPMFDGRDMLERLRNKRVILAGDSLNRNMWESLACLLYASIPSSTVEVEAANSLYKVLKAKGIEVGKA